MNEKAIVASCVLLLLPISFPVATIAAQEGEPEQARTAGPHTHVQQSPKGAPKTERSQPIPEVLVLGSRVLNTDIRRTEDDAQPYVIFDREEIQRSGALTVEEFLRYRLSMNAQNYTASQSGNPLGNISQVDLRGLGTNQTIILLDGHRSAATIVEGIPGQEDINGIPLSAIERIEVLPTTASGIYGGSATGGVVNIVLRRDHVGTEFEARYDNTFDSDSGIAQFGAITAFDLERGATNVLLSGNYLSTNAMLAGDRNFTERGRRAIHANNPAFYTSTSLINPPLGATTNIRSLNGSPLFGPGTPHFTYVPVGYTASQGLAPLQAVAGQYNFDLANSAQVGGRFRAVLLETRSRSGLATIRRDFGDRVTAFLEGGGSHRQSVHPSGAVNSVSLYNIAASAPNNPFGQTIRVSIVNSALDSVESARTEDYRLLGGFVVRLPGRWSLGADHNLSRFKARYTLERTMSGAEVALINNGSINVLQDPALYQDELRQFVSAPTEREPVGSTSRETVLRAGGPLGSLWGREVALSAMLAHRKEYFDASSNVDAAGQVTFLPDKYQIIDSAYLEARLPVISPQHGVGGIRELDLQLAARYDEYETEGVSRAVTPAQAVTLERQVARVRSSNPTVGLRYVPLEGVMLRASWGTGFLPPSTLQLAPSPAPSSGAFNNMRDPRRGGEIVGTVPFMSGGNADLSPEESESTSVGLVLAPPSLGGLHLAVDYTRIRKTGNIASPQSFATADLGSFEATYPERVTRAPPDPGDPFPVGRVTALDLRLTNLSHAEVDAIDLNLDYRAELGSWGALDAYALATRTLRFESQLSPIAPVVDGLGVTSGNPPKVLANAGLAWRKGGLSLGWSGRYVHSYLVATSANTRLNQGNGGKVPAQSFHDLYGRYRFQEDLPLLSGLELQVGLRNVLNEEPPLDAADQTRFYSPRGDVRGRTYYIALRMSL